ncbi:MAG: gfo/Idh/MocA family oxidoreductase [Alphaproteobacteria bacterium]|nr:MAG: gfo/Idh/MocA family oxidoreductase [Alphaproteobacteria bacterium]
MKTTPRRSFLKKTGFGVSAFYIARSSWAQSSPGDTIHTAVIGFRSRGRGHISAITGLKHKGVALSALCDVDSKVLAGGVANLEKKDIKVKSYTDLRRVFEDKDIDAVTIATPNHWHALAAIWACQAGKDVYVEKPVSHNVWEGRQIVKAARKYKRMVQTGTQNRSRLAVRQAVNWIRDGKLGPIRIVRGLCYKLRDSIGLTDGPHPVPPNINYDLWCGPAPLTPPRRNSKRYGPVHYDWHWFWDYGNGDLGNQGIHQMDIARWFLGENALSPRVWSIGGRVGYRDDAETPNTQIVYHGYEKAPLIFEVRGLPRAAKQRGTSLYMGTNVGVIVHCEGGHLIVSNSATVRAYDTRGKEIKQFTGGGDHFENFFHACRTRRHEDLNADILEGHLSSALCHTGNISYRLGQPADREALVAAVENDLGGRDALDRMLQHLAANRVSLEEYPLTLGPNLKMDPRTERFPGNEAANALLTRKYRKPFVVPEEV